MFDKIYNKDTIITREKAENFIAVCLKQFSQHDKLLVIPPDISRLSSGGGMITDILYNMFPQIIKKIIPATGTHQKMNKTDISGMFKNVPLRLFEEHNWKKNLYNAGTVPEDFISEKTGVKGYNIPVEVNSAIFSKNYTAVISIGQVVPHEVTGMSNHNKNILIGTGGGSIINLSHYISALYGIEKLLGMAENPLRDILDYAESNFFKNIGIFYILTVCGYDNAGQHGIKGIFAGFGRECYVEAARASAEENIIILDKKITRAVVYLDSRYRSLWIGNKAVYRTRLAMADNSELIIAAPWVDSFGEDKELDRLIRKYGYKGKENIIRAVESSRELRENLSAAAHLIHGSAENRFKVTWCPGRLKKSDIINAGYSYADPEKLPEDLNPAGLTPGCNSSAYFIPDPGQGLWTAC